ncbi:MAG: HAD family phosphatase [Vicinamibacteraceae bacterium]|nr:HAD family phosphatase [Vicinamibacteraceae bacterium]
MSLRAVVFDFDGVLAASEPLHLRAWQDVLADVGVTLTVEDYYANYLGYDDDGLIRVLNEDQRLDLTPAQRRALVDEKSRLLPALLRDPDVLYPGAAGVVRELARHVPLAIASGALRPEIELVLEGAGLRDCFAAIVASGETTQSKPAPDPYIRAVALLDRAGYLDASNGGVRHCVAVEDSRWGLESARAAGLRTVAVTTSYEAAELTAADLVVGGVADLTLARLSALVESR